MTYFSIVRFDMGELSRFSLIRGANSSPSAKRDDGNLFKMSEKTDPEKSVGEDGADFDGLFSMVISAGQ